jgi:multiple sugar transport system substrate-binding protein
MFPAPDNKTSTSTLMGGWQFNIPVTSSHKDIAWEIIVNLLKPEVPSPWLFNTDNIRRKRRPPMPILLEVYTIL